jgi:aryl-alcohol dehydrogenase-like predicted oxidoreductase
VAETAAVAEARGVSMAQVALAWVLAQPGITSVIVGASGLEQLDDNLAAADLVLTADELDRLDAATALAPIYPAWWDPAMGIPAPNEPDGPEQA